MKVKSLLYAGALMAVALFASCSNNDGDGVQLGKGGIQFNASINGSNPVQVSRATENSWQDGDKIGIFSANDGETGFAASNVQYTTTAAGVLSAVTDGINYKDASTKTNFRAYYPYNASATAGTVPVNVTDQSDQAKLDLLYAKADGKTSADQNIALAFDHQLVKVVFNIKAGTGVTLDGLKTTLSGSATSGKFDVGTGQFTQDSNIQDILFKVASDNATAEAIVLPATSLDGKTVTFTTSDGSKGTVDLSKELKVNGTLLKSLDRGSKYTIPVTLGESTTPGEFAVSFGNATISPWNNVAGDEVIVDFGKGDTPEPGEGDGTKDKPYSVEQALTKTADAGKSAWVQGVIVGELNNDGTLSATGVADYNVVLASTAGETDITKCFVVKISSAIRSAVGLKSKPSNRGKVIKLQGTFKAAPNYGNPNLFIMEKSGAYEFVGSDTPEPTPSDVYLEETFSNGEGNFKIEDKSLGEGLTYVWKADTKYHYIKASAYLGKSIPSESWLISPSIDLSKATSPILVFEHANNKFSNLDVMKQQISVEVNDGSGWKNVPIDKYGDNASWNFVTATIDLSAYKGKIIQIVFKYISSSESAGSWEIKNLKVTER